MNEKPEAVRLAENLENPWHALMVSSRLLPGVDPLIVGGLRLDAAAELRRQHAEIERLKAERDEAVKAEREACAKVCDEVECGSSMMIEERQTANECARKIRARGEVPR